MEMALLKSQVLAWGYRNFLKPWFFRQDAEAMHEKIIRLGRFLGKAKWRRQMVSALFDYQNPCLAQEISGIKFANPIGLAAGFDKDARLLDILPAVGFGFLEVGSITGEKCEGNPKPRLWRLPQARALWVNYGLANEGCEKILPRLKLYQSTVPLGVSIAKTNCQKTAEPGAATADYLKAYHCLANVGSYTTLNISCPNAFGGQPFTEPALLDSLLSAIDAAPTRKPVFVKLPPDLDFARIDGLLEVVNRHKIRGIICSNLTKHAGNLIEDEKSIAPRGGHSGKPLEPLANRLIAHVYRQTRGRYVIIGCGGVFSAQDAYKKIRLGASLVQLITGMIYQGPQLLGQINHGLARLLRQDGFSNVAQAVGRDVR